MKILIVGSDTRGSWQMRGVQLGRVLGARVTTDPSDGDWAWADLVVLVKRAAMIHAARARRLSVPVAWDALDFWAQPEENGRRDYIEKARLIAASAGVDLIVGATQQMASDLGGVYLSHHCRIGLTPTPPRPAAKVVAYDGTKKYLGRWAKQIEQACLELGLTFVLNPKDLRSVDLLVAFRDGDWDGDVCRKWKSGVKCVNAIASGRPMFTHDSAAEAELRPVGVIHNTVGYAVTEALKAAVTPEIREQAYEDGRARAPQFTVEAIADQYRAILRHVTKRVAA